MTSVRSLLTRVAKLEAARVTPKSPFEVAYGSFEAFADHVRAQVDARKLDRMDMLGADGNGGVLEALRGWHRNMVWHGAQKFANGRAR